MRLSSFLKVSQFWWKRIKNSSVSAEYKQWRHGFILERIRLMIWVAIIFMPISAIVNWTVIIPFLDLGSSHYEFYQQNGWLMLGITIVQLLQFLLAFLLLKVPFARRYPIVIFLSLTWTLLLMPQVANIIFFGKITLAGYGWITSFSLSAILLPVMWQWRLFSQGMVLGQFLISYLLFGFKDPFVEQEIEYFSVIYSTAIVCFFINLGIFIHEKLLQQEFELRRQLRLFLYTVSHDLRNPVLGKIFLLKSLLNPAVEKVLVDREILITMLESGDRQLKLIDSLLEAYHTENKGILLRPRPVRLDTLIESVIAEMQPFIEREKATVTKLIPTKIPLVNIDPLQVRRVYENLIANALEHNRSGLHLTFQVDKYHTKEQNLWLYCTVSDNGSGIPPQQQSKLFDLYTGAVSKKQSLNVGLGLYISRQIINAHGGEIGVNSSPKGTIFWFTLPIAKNNFTEKESNSLLHDSIS